MFDLEKQIAEWRTELSQAGVQRPEVLNELESHLRDDLAQQKRAGIKPDEAFAAAVQRLGRAEALTAEFKKLGRLKPVRQRVMHSLFALAGVPSQSVTDLNIEPGWATYLRAAAFVAPTLCVWWLSMIFVVPQVKSLGSRADGFTFPNPIRVDFNLAAFVGDHVLIALVIGILALCWLEWRVGSWPRFRRAAFGFVIFILNSAFLISVFLFFVAAALVATGMYHPVK